MEKKALKSVRESILDNKTGECSECFRKAFLGITGKWVWKCLVRRQIPCPIKRQGLLKVLVLDMVKEFAARPTGPDVAITGIVLPVCTTARVPRCRGLRPHRRVIDWTRFLVSYGMYPSELFSAARGRLKHRFFDPRQVLQTEIKKIHSSDPVVVTPVTARVTDIFVPVMDTVLLSDPPAFWTAL